MIENPDFKNHTRNMHNQFMRRASPKQNTFRQSRTPITLYRGCSPETAKGIFWTTGLFEAALYASNKDNPVIARAEFRPQDIVSTQKSLGNGPKTYFGVRLDSGEHVVHIRAVRDALIKIAPFEEVAHLYRQTGRWPESQLAERDELFANELQPHWRRLPTYSVRPPLAKNAEQETNR